jgi:uncharacterized protein
MTSHGREAELAPASPEERMLLLDVLRGFAMFGVLWSNLNDWYGTTEPSSGLQYAFKFAQDALVETRFYSLLGFLFGMGFALQIIRAERRGMDVKNVFLRRMAALLAMGMVHGMLVWHGDVLSEYALLGMLLVFFRRLSARALPWAAAATFLIAPYLIGVAVAGLRVKFPEANWDAANQIYEHGTFCQIVSQNRHDYLFWYKRWAIFVFPSFLALFLLGLWAVRIDLLKRLTARRSRLVWALALALAATIAGAYLNAHLERWWPAAKSQPTVWEAAFSARALRPIVGRSVYDLWVWSNAALYATILALVVSTRAGARRLAPLAAVGRMSLTTYLMQTLVSITLFYPWGLGWFGHVGYDGMLVITVVLFALQMAASVWWLGRYRFGPMEWIWRSVSYGQPQAMRRIAA